MRRIDRAVFKRMEQETSLSGRVYRAVENHVCVQIVTLAGTLTGGFAETKGVKVHDFSINQAITYENFILKTLKHDY